MLEARGEDTVPHAPVRQIERREEPPAPDIRHEAGELVGQLAEASQEVLTDSSRVLDQRVLFDDLEITGAADHVHQVAPPRSS